MTKAPSPKYDQLRAMREAKAARASPVRSPTIQALREKAAAVPAKRPPKRKKP